ncbi:hypothetical protein GCM10009069_26830 [Algimonas arctica]|uniref:DUF4386 domain-containing protein n=1 Tax=Algimonas arctica TaxID=1479486 RepID=A0A8J3G3J5_9PROT|nr:DUF4386 family protein [Algimonas arctica]GHB02741.1 hypothetical protein GCM10009069_26830 [Algimonas arctica]
MLTHSEKVRTARVAGVALLLGIIIGIIAAMTVSAGIDINLSADVEATARAMLNAETRLHGKAYVALLLIGLQLLFLFAAYRLLRDAGPLLAGWSVGVGLVSIALGLFGVVAAMNAAELAGTVAYQTLASGEQRLLLAGLQATTDYTSFHLGLVMSSAANAAIFILFLRSGDLPKIIAGGGVFASLFVVLALVIRDFIPVMGNDLVTMAFMVCNLVALVSTGLYLSIRGVRA